MKPSGRGRLRKRRPPLPSLPSLPQRQWPGRKRRSARPPKVYPVSKCRWKVERTHGWLDNWRRLVVRYDRHPHVYIAFLTIACFMTTLSRILG